MFKRMQFENLFMQKDASLLIYLIFNVIYLIFNEINFIKNNISNIIFNDAYNIIYLIFNKINFIKIFKIFL